MIDLHIHSHFSDGECSYEQIRLLMAERGAKIFSIADHNYIHPQSAELVSSTEEPSFLQGVEISTIDHSTGVSAHMLGYSRRFNIAKLNAALQPVVDGYNARAERIVQAMDKQYDVSIDFSELRKEPAVFVSRNRIGLELQRRLPERFDFRQAVKAAYLPGESATFMSDTADAIDLINSCNGTAVLAHPGTLPHTLDLREFVARLSGAGLRGVEVYHPKHDEQMRATLLGLATKHNLLVTGGSDWHGEHYSQWPLGSDAPAVVEKTCRKFFEF